MNRGMKLTQEIRFRPLACRCCSGLCFFSVSVPGIRSCIKRSEAHGRVSAPNDLGFSCSFRLGESLSPGFIISSSDLWWDLVSIRGSAARFSVRGRQHTLCNSRHYRRRRPGRMGKSLLPLGRLGNLASGNLFCGYWIYFAAMESSPWEATLGKIALRLRATDFDGHRITFTRATGRYLGKISSLATFLVGFFIAMFTKRKQPLHDLFAKTLVLDA